MGMNNGNASYFKLMLDHGEKWWYSRRENQEEICILLFRCRLR
jgi:hypothetical protein